MTEFAREQRAGAISVVRADLVPGARALGLFEPDGIARVLAAGARVSGGRASVAIVAWPESGEQVVVRPLRHGGLLAPLLGGVYASPARVLAELTVTNALFEAGAPVVPPAFALARRSAGPFWICAIGTRHTPGRDLASEAAGPGRASALRAAAQALRGFHDRGGRHADLNATNVLVHAGTATLLDLDRARAAAPVPSARRMREIARLWRSLAKRGAALRAAEREAFLLDYCAGDGALLRELDTASRRERLRSALHALRYPRVGK